jgi:hypothetical protein
MRFVLVLRFGFGIEIVELVFNCEIRYFLVIGFFEWRRRRMKMTDMMSLNTRRKSVPTARDRGRTCRNYCKRPNTQDTSSLARKVCLPGQAGRTFRHTSYVPRSHLSCTGHKWKHVDPKLKDTMWNDVKV